MKASRRFRLWAALAVSVVGAGGLTLGIAAIPAYGVDAIANGKLAFVADEAGKPQVFTVKPDGTGLTRLTNRPNGAGEYGLAWSPDASSLLMVLSNNHDLIYEADKDGAAVRRLSPRCAGNCLGDGSPTYTRTGAKIAFERAFGRKMNQHCGCRCHLHDERRWKRSEAANRKEVTDLDRRPQAELVSGRNENRLPALQHHRATGPP